MSDLISTDVLICGAGAAGLTLAVDLARRGVDFRLIEKTAGPFPGSRGKGLQPRSQEVLEDLGVLDRIAATGGPYPPQRLHKSDGTFEDSTMFEPGEVSPAEPYVTPLLSPQFLTERALRDRLAEFGQQPWFGAELVGFEQDADGVTARIAKPDKQPKRPCRCRATSSWAAMAGAASRAMRSGSSFPARPWACARWWPTSASPG